MRSRAQSDAVTFSTVLLCKLLCVSEAEGSNVTLQKNLNFWKKKVFSSWLRSFMALGEMPDRFAESAQLLVHIFYFLRNLAPWHYSRLCRTRASERAWETETWFAHRPRAQRQLSSRFTRRGVDLNFPCFQVTLDWAFGAGCLNCVLINFYPFSEHSLLREK